MDDKPILDPIQIIIDTDPGIDDALAILLALASPEINVRAITITHGNTTVRNATRNIVTLMSILEQQVQYSGEAGTADLRKFKASCPVIAVGLFHLETHAKALLMSSQALFKFRMYYFICYGR